MATLNSIYKILSTQPLQLDELSEYYYNLFPSRGSNPISRIKRRLLEDKMGNLHCLLAGFGGCGKSTELNKMQQELENDFLTLNLSIRNELDPINFNYTDLIILIMEKLFKASEEHTLHINKILLKNIYDWTSTEEVQKVKEFSTEFDAQAGGEAGITVPFLSKFFVALKNVTRRNYSAKTTINEVIEHQLSDLLNLCNDLIREISLALFGQESPKGLLIIIEDTDKLRTDIAESLFYTYSAAFTTLNTNIIFTYPIALKCSQKANIINSYFDNNVYELPMVKIHEKGGDYNPIGIKCLKGLIEKRGIIDCFESETVLESFIKTSGGCIRDLFRMIIDAADFALDDEKEKIGDEDFKKAFIKLKRAYRETIAEKAVKDPSGKIIRTITADEYYQTLEKLNQSTNKQLENNELDLDLRANLCILGYNGEGWYDVHPAVKEILKERENEREHRTQQ